MHSDWLRSPVRINPMKVFKNVRMYRFTEQEPTFAGIKSAAEKLAFRGASNSLDTEWSGFVPVLDGTEELALQVGHWTFVKLQTESRILPSGAVKDAVDARIREIEDKEARKVYRKEKQQIKEDVLAGMIPRAFTRKKHTQAVIDHDQGLIYADARSTSDASAVLNALREGLGSLPVRPIRTVMPLRLAAQTWIKNVNVPDTLSLGERCKLSGHDSERVQYTNHPLGVDEVQAHLAAGLAPAAVELTISDAGHAVASFTLNEDLSLQRFALSDAVLLERDEREDKHDQALADATLMMHALGRCRDAITEALGGEEKAGGGGHA